MGFIGSTVPMMGQGISNRASARMRGGSGGGGSSDGGNKEDKNNNRNEDWRENLDIIALFSMFILAIPFCVIISYIVVKNSDAKRWDVILYKNTEIVKTYENVSNLCVFTQKPKHGGQTRCDFTHNGIEYTIHGDFVVKEKPSVKIEWF